MRILSRLMGRGVSVGQPKPPASLPAALRVYAIGDVHGRADLLDAMLTRIFQHAAQAAPVERCRIIVLGDVIDRGPDSRAVIERLLAPGLPDGFEMEILMGNHERMMLDFLEDPAAGRLWLTYGGLSTLASYGVAPPRGSATLERLAPVQAELLECLPPEHRCFLEQRPLWREIGDFVFVHAGIWPGCPMIQQDAADLLWIRDRFLTSTERFDKVVVHGHSVTEEPEVLPSRIGIDTGACHTGVLTCLVLEGEGRCFLQTAPDQARRNAPQSR